MEVLRSSSIVPFGVTITHKCTEDTMLRGFAIPKETLVNANFYNAHHDPVVWGDPEVFRPERFLNPDGTCVERHESFMPFSVGRRACMGEPVARDMLFLFLAMILQNFNVEIPPGYEMVSLEAIGGRITRHPAKFHVTMLPRH